MSRFRPIAVLLALAFSSSPALAQKPRTKPAPKPKDAEPKPGTIAVAVVEIAGGNVYLKPGRAGGVRNGARVTINRREYVVSSATTSFAVIELGDAPPPAEASSGTVTSSAESEDQARQLPPPQPLEALRHQWSAWHRPADDQHPKPVPLGLPDRSHRYDVLVYGYGGGVANLGTGRGGFARAELGVRAHVEPLASKPLAFDLDGSAQQWVGTGVYDRDGARPTFRVRQLQLGYGDASRFFAGLGRIRYAAATLGPIDGLRLRAPIGSDTSVAAFGGFLPDPGNGSFRTDSQRFGGEVGFAKPETRLRPEAALVVSGSTYDGRLDERRLSAVAGIYPGQSRVGAHAEVALFDKDNPWGVNPFEVTAAGIDGRANLGVVSIGASADMRQQERSRYLATFLPPSWFCSRVASAGTGCDPRATTVYQVRLDGGLTLDRVALSLGGALSKNLERADTPSQAGAFASARILRIARIFRIDVNGTASTGTYVDVFSGGGGPGVTLFGDRVDASLYLRHAVLQYRVGGVLGGDSVGGYVTVIPHRDLVASLQAEGTRGDDYSALMGSFVLVWRPRL